MEFLELVLLISVNPSGADIFQHFELQVFRELHITHCSVGYIICVLKICKSSVEVSHDDRHLSEHQRFNQTAHYEAYRQEAHLKTIKWGDFTSDKNLNGIVK